MPSSTHNIRIHDIKGSNDVVLYPETSDDVVVITSSNQNLPSGVSSLKDIVDSLGALAFEDTVGTNVTTGTDYAIIRSTDSNNTNDSDIMASAKAVKSLNDVTVKTTTDQTVAGTKVFTDAINIGGDIVDGTVTGGVTMTYDAVNDIVNFN